MVHISFQKSDVTKNCRSNKKMFANSQASVSNLQMLFLIIRTIHFNSESRKVKTIFELEYLFFKICYCHGGWSSRYYCYSQSAAQHGPNGRLKTLLFFWLLRCLTYKNMYYIPQIKS